MATDFIEVYGAREHNLKNIDVKIPRNQLVVITGLSGSGKSSLAFDTIYAEGQRRYIETFSAYARQFLGGLERPDVDKIDGLSPVIAIEQKTTNRNPRSTVGTITEIYDFLRLLYARSATAISYETGEPMVQYSQQQIQELIEKEYAGKKIVVLSPLVRSRKGHYRELFQAIGKKGYVQVRVDGELQELRAGMKLDRYKTHDVEVVIDKLVLEQESSNPRLGDAISKAMYEGNGVLMLLDLETNNVRYFSKDLMCPTTGISYPLPEPNTFSFNSPKGACPNCNGIGYIKRVDIDKILPDTSLSLNKSALAPMDLIKSKNRINKQIEYILAANEDKDTTPFRNLKQKTQDEILYGAKERIEVKLKFADVAKTYSIDWEGIIPYVERVIQDKLNPQGRSFAKRFARNELCEVCAGTRLRKESLFYRLDGKSIGDLSQMDLLDFQQFMLDLPKSWNKKQQKIGNEIRKEILQRIQFLVDVGLQYLTINRSSNTLSGGEAQRIRLATQIGSQLVNVLYILDEPSIGLHQRDNARLIDALKSLRDIGNSVLVVEHDQEMIEAADYVLDLGPAAGKKGGEIVWEGLPSNIKKAKTLTAEFLNGNKRIALPEKRREGNGEYLEILGATGNNLQKVNLKIPLQTLTVISGVSGSGKSSLINGTLYRILNQHFFHAIQEPLPYKKIKGLDLLDKVIEVNQSPIGRTPRSNPATYTGVFSEIRNIFTQLPEAKIRGYKPGRFSFNVKGGRCETCQGAGLKVIEMNFLPDIQVHCETCHGKRFNRETLEVRYKGKSIADVLEMTVDEAVVFFEPIPRIHRKIKMLNDVGLGYITLGQQSTTLSGGEAQRVKLATELSKKQTGKTLYILDEPTTGLHFEDIRVLMEVIQKLVDLGNSVVIIEHNLDVIKLADHLIDIGPEGGRGGGKIVAQGTPEEVAKARKSFTGRFLKAVL